MTIDKIAKCILENKKVLVFSHNRPDGDTIGSGVALYYALKQFNIECTLVCDSEIPDKFKFICGDLYKTTNEITESFDAHIAVDCSCDSMIGGAYNLFISNKNTFNIDHHVSNTKYAKFNYVLDNASCCENIYDLITELKAEITPQIANSLLLGIITDTGAFAHSNATEKTLLYASKLVGLKADIHEIIQKMFKEQSKERAKLFSHTTNKISYYLDGKVAVLVISEEDLKTCNAKDNMTEGFIDFALSVRGVEVAISLLEIGTRKYKISFRSKGVVNVNEIASIYGGGGHILASGAMLCGYLEDIIDKLVYNVKQRIWLMDL